MRCNACGGPLLTQAEVGKGLCSVPPCAPRQTEVVYVRGRRFEVRPVVRYYMSGGEVLEAHGWRCGKGCWSQTIQGAVEYRDGGPGDGAVARG